MKKDRRKLYKVLVVDSKPRLMRRIANVFESPAKVERASTADTALQMLALNNYNLVLLQLKLPLYSGLDLAEEIRKIKPDLPILPYSDERLKREFAEIVKLGFPIPTVHPNDDDEIIARCREYQEAGVWYRRIDRIIHEMNENYGFSKILSSTVDILGILDSLSRVTSAQVPVMITGESGTGKELVARMIHATGDRNQEPFVAVNCAAVPEGLLESQFFGHERGAFTGANSTVMGKFEIADRGTMFLDEIGEMSPVLQAKLLRVLEHGEFERVGGNETIKVDVKLITATNRNLPLMVTEKKFREDLLYRINVFPIHLPPLKDRGDDIKLLSYYFLRSASRRNHRQVLYISDDAISSMYNYTWPGNIRELENAIERALLVSDGVRIVSDDFQEQEDQWIPEDETSDDSSSRNIKFGVNADDITPLRIIEMKVIRRALKITKNNIALAARKLGISRNTLYKKIRMIDQIDLESD